jgi:hypothetical protein
MIDTFFFEELEDINDVKLRDGLWSVVSIYFKKRNSIEKALDGAEKIVDLYTEPILDNWYRGLPIQSADHYRTRVELIEISKNPKLIDSLREYGLLEIHPKWPIEQRNHPQAPYRPIVSMFAEVRASAIIEERYSA